MRTLIATLLIMIGLGFACWYHYIPGMFFGGILVAAAVLGFFEDLR